MAQYDRRTLLASSGAAAAAGAVIATGSLAGLDKLTWRGKPGADANILRSDRTPGWDEVRALFPLAPDWIDMSAMLITSHPAPVAEAIERHRRGLDQNPIVYLEENNRRLVTETRQAAARYLGGIDADDVALTDSTTMGVALVYNALRLKPGQEVLTTDQDYYVTHESLRLSAARGGTQVRRIKLYDAEELGAISAAALVDRITREIRRETRALALTWVHSSTGLKLPIGQIAAALAPINATREADDRVVLCVDGVHGFGIEDVSFAELGCDFLMAGCHKWLFGPRGTGIVAATKQGWRSVTPTIPSFFDVDAYGRWIRNEPASSEATTAAAFMPGGFKPFEHVWALSEAFALHEAMKKKRVAQRTADLAAQLKEGLAGIGNIALRTPRSRELSAGIVSFDVNGRAPGEVVERLRRGKVIGTVAPYATPHVRLTPSVRNTAREIETTLALLREVA